MTDWKLRKPRGQCAVTGKMFEPGDEYYSAIVEQDGELRRLEVIAELFDESWQKKSFGYWKRRVPEPEQESDDGRRLVSIVVLQGFFHKLVKHSDPEHAGLLYLVSLLLMRKKILKLNDIEFNGDDEFLVMTDKQRGEYRIRDPHLTPEKTAPLKEKLAALFEDPELFAESEAEEGTEEAGDAAGEAETRT